jgi:predicted transcriptional regulator
MTRSLTIEIPDDSGQTLEELGQRQNRSAEDVAQEILQRVLSVARFRQLREELQPQAEAAGFCSEDEILDAIS